MATQLQQPTWSEPQLRGRLEPELRRRAGPATLGDLVAATGLPAEQTEPLLRELLDEYQGRLAVDENGELIYSFPRGLRGETTWRDLLRQARATLWAGFKLVYKAGILVVLVAYFLVFLTLMIAALVAMLAAKSGTNSDVDLDFEGCGCSPLDLLWFMDPPSFRSAQPAFQRRTPTPYRAKPRGQERRVPPWQLAYEFVFGPEPPAADALAEERMLLAYVRQHQGLLTAADVAGLTGRSLEAAEGVLLHLMVAHGGDVEVSENGTLIYTFDRLMVSASQPDVEEGRRWSWWWEQAEPPVVLNRNSSAANWALGLLNGFNLVWSGLFTLNPGLLGPKVPLWVGGLLGPAPLAFSALFFVIPLVRRTLAQAEDARRAKRNALREVARRVFFLHVVRDDVGVVTPESVVRAGSEGGRSLGLEEATSGLEQLARAWDAEPDSDAEGTLGWRFERLRQVALDVKAAREARDPAQFRLGAVSYDSEE